MKIYSEIELDEAIDLLLKITHVYRVEQFFLWRDYRIVVFDNEIISAYERIPLSIFGNGAMTVRELLIEKQYEFQKLGRPETIDMEDIRIEKNLNRANMNLDSILEKGIYMQLLDNANLSTGWESRDYTESIHQEFRDIAIKATKDMWLRLCGVDIMTSDITESREKNGEYVIIEMNAAPGLDNYITSGKKQRAIIKEMYRKIIRNV